MSLLYYDPAFLRHGTVNSPECAERIIPAARRINLLAMHLGCTRPSWRALSAERLALVHDPAYIETVRAFSAAGGGEFDEDTHISAESYDVAALASGAVVDAVQQVIEDTEKRAFCLVRPPGHHASRARAMGFCLFNHVALGAQSAVTERGLSRVLIVDWDVHHGNGTQDIFWEDGRVGYLSIHRDPFYPGTGGADETGSGAGLGTKFNVPIAPGTSRGDYVRQFETAVERAADKLRPELLLISAGFDAHRLDPIGSLGLETEDYIRMTQIVFAAAQTHAGGKIVSVLEGGYQPHVLADCVDAHVQELLF